MKTPLQLFAALLVTGSLLGCNQSELHTVEVSGHGLDFYPDSTRMVVFPYGADFRFDPPVASALLADGAFELSFRDSTTCLYELVVEEELHKGSFQTFGFFSDDKPLRFAFRRKFGTTRAEVSGSSDNEELFLYRNRRATLCEPTDSMLYELDQWRISNYGPNGYPETGSAETERLRARYEEISDRQKSIIEASGYERWLEARIRHHKTLAGLLKVTQALDSELRKVERDAGHTIDTMWLNLYRDYRSLYPGNRLVQRTDERLATIERLAPGAPFPDFTAPALDDGTRRRFGELIEGRIAVLDCWASWCGSCRKHSIELIPIYEQYRDRGFTVVGVAREYGSLDDMRLAVKRDNYPWVQLYDLDGAEGIWKLYGLSSAGGGIFLIDLKGRIVERVADVATIRKYLEQHLGR